ncbi:MAG: DUF2752 domain-containing protein [Bacteroidales bacterium]|nr:DUF2752 domain-containing protein [Clostridium sp.]MCM1203372.1 DUF2752 domain-containing protein [Bacteroidales bacterium]
MEKGNINYSILKRDFLIVNITSGLAVLIMFILMLLQRYGVLPYVPCGIHAVLHMYCPGCGGTRAVFALLHGQLLQSLYYNPAVVLGAVLVIYYETGVLVTLIKKNGKRYYYPKGGLAYGYIFVIAVFTVVRNWLLVSRGMDMLKDFL